MATEPKGLGAAGAELWASILADVPEGCELDAKETAALAHAARMADAIADLEAIVSEQGYLATGVARQVVVHPAVTEIRQTRVALHRLLSSIGLDAAQALTPRQRRAQRAADARWNRRDALREANG
jgi:hypothetical protein